jgi:hypothetical protein
MYASAVCKYAAMTIAMTGITAFRKGELGVVETRAIIGRKNASDSSRIGYSNARLLMKVGIGHRRVARGIK